MAFAEVNGAVAHYRDEGRVDARAIVFINALGMDLRIWDDLVGPLANAYRIVRYDKRGHGLSELPAGPALIADYSADLAALLDRLEVGGAVIVGLSMGGLVAQALYRQRPDLVAAMALCGTAAKIGTEESWRQRMDEVARGGIEAIAEATMQRWFTAGFRARRPDELAGWRAMLTRAPRDGYLTACGAQMRADLRPYCAAIAVAGPVRRRRRRRLDSALARARTCRPNRPRAVRNHPRRRPHELHRASGCPARPDRGVGQGRGGLKRRLFNVRRL